MGSKTCNMIDSIYSYTLSREYKMKIPISQVQIEDYVIIHDRLCRVMSISIDSDIYLLTFHMLNPSLIYATKIFRGSDVIEVVTVKLTLVNIIDWINDEFFMTDVGEIVRIPDRVPILFSLRRGLHPYGILARYEGKSYIFNISRRGQHGSVSKHEA